MANKVNIDPRYLKYSTKDEVEALLEKVENPDTEPQAGSDALITSGAVAGALGNYTTKEEMETATKVSTEESVRSIVSNYVDPDAEPEPEPEPEPEEEA